MHKLIEPAPLDRIFPGSWIHANFNVWIGAEEDNKAWRYLLAARQAFDEAEKAKDIPEDRRALAREELYIAEGSDWNWWYGPEHESANRVEFDQIYREHLANVYRALGMPAPPELSQPILNVQDAPAAHTLPSGPLTPKINGVVDSYFEWLGAGVYEVDQRSGSMHGKRALVKCIHYGADDDRVYIRVDFEEDAAKLKGLEVRLNNGAVIAVEPSGAAVKKGGAEAAFHDILEIAIPGAAAENGLSLSFWQDGLPIMAIPTEGLLQPCEAAQWSV
jgi:alpha-amylase/alpha-mannosidase (GH57 family)